MSVKNDLKKTKIKGLIFKEILRRGYSLEGNTRVWNIADSKLWYLDEEQAQAFLDLANSKEYFKEITEKEIGLINGNMKEILDKVDGGNINIVDLGCGDGKKASFYISGLKSKGVSIRYCPIDISPYMVEKAINTMNSLSPNEIIAFQWNISDFENLENVSYLLRIGEFQKNFFLLMGNTLGNFEINELLYEISNSMKKEDYLLIGNGLDNRNIEEILKSYSTPENHNFLHLILSSIGLNESEIKLGTRFNNSRVEIYYEILNDKKIKWYGRALELKAGDRIIVAVSYKYDKESFKEFLDMYFETCDLFISNDGGYCLALCKK